MHGQARCATSAPTQLHTNVTYETHFSACRTSRSVVSRGGVPCWAAGVRGALSLMYAGPWRAQGAQASAASAAGLGLRPGGAVVFAKPIVAGPDPVSTNNIRNKKIIS